MNPLFVSNYQTFCYKLDSIEWKMSVERISEPIELRHCHV